MGEVKLPDEKNAKEVEAIAATIEKAMAAMEGLSVDDVFDLYGAVETPDEADLPRVTRDVVREGGSYG